MKKLFSLVCLLLLTTVLLVGCGSDKKKLVIGLDDHFPPMGFRDDKNTLVGFDIDMAREAAKRMNREVEFKPIDWSAKEAELNGKRVDMLWNGFTITPARLEKLAFSKPYMENRQVLVVVADSTIANKNDLVGKTIGLQDGSSSLDAVAKDPINTKFKEIKKYADNIAAFMDLKAGRTQAIVLDEVVARYYIAKKANEYKVLSDNFGSEEYGVGLRKEDKELVAQLQKALDEMNKDGTSAKISQKWFGANIIK